MDTILGVLFFVDSGVCKTYTTSTACTKQRSLDQIHSLCSWDVDADPQCVFNTNIGGDFLSNLILAVIIALCAIPFDAIMYFTVREFRNYICSIFLRNIQSKEAVGALDIDGLQPQAVTMLRS